MINPYGRSVLLLGVAVVSFAVGAPAASAQGARLKQRAVLVGDYDGNGHHDLLIIQEESSRSRMRFSLEFSWGGGIWTAPRTVLLWPVPSDLTSLYTVTGDINKDGMTDLMILGRIASSKKARVYSFFSNGRGFIQGPDPMIQPTAALEDVGTLSQDLDGDRKSDLIMIRSLAARSGTDFQAWLSNGTGGWSSCNALGFSTPVGKLIQAVAALRIESQRDRARGRAAALGEVDPRLVLAETFIASVLKFVDAERLLAFAESLLHSPGGFLRFFERFQGDPSWDEGISPGQNDSEVDAMIERLMGGKGPGLTEGGSNNGSWLGFVIKEAIIHTGAEAAGEAVGGALGAMIPGIAAGILAYEIGKKLDEHKDDLVNQVYPPNEYVINPQTPNQREQNARIEREEADKAADKARGREQAAEKDLAEKIKAFENAKTDAEKKEAKEALDKAYEAFEKARKEREEAEKKAREAKEKEEAAKKQNGSKHGLEPSFPFSSQETRDLSRTFRHAKRYGINVVYVLNPWAKIFEWKRIYDRQGPPTSNPNPEKKLRVRFTEDQIRDLIAKLLAMIPADPPDAYGRAGDVNGKMAEVRKVRVPGKREGNPNPEEPERSPQDGTVPPQPGPDPTR